MPFIEIKTDKKISPESEAAFRRELGTAITTIRGKTEKWLMLNFLDGLRMSFGGNAEEAMALVSVELFGGASAAEYDALTKKLTALVASELGIAPARIYVKYTELEHWGWNGENF